MTTSLGLWTYIALSVLVFLAVALPVAFILSRLQSVPRDNSEPSPPRPMWLDRAAITLAAITFSWTMLISFVERREDQVVRANLKETQMTLGDMERVVRRVTGAVTKLGKAVDEPQVATEVSTTIKELDEIQAAIRNSVAKLERASAPSAQQ